MSKLIGGFQVGVGLTIAGLWVLLLAAGQVPEVAEGLTAIWFHIGAELATAALLLVAGVALLRAMPRVRLLSAVALGALLYTTLNSPGHYADQGDWAAVVMFAVLAVATAGAIAGLVATDPSRRRASGRIPPVRQPATADHRDAVRETVHQ